MKALVGIETLESGICTLNMLARLRPSEPCVEILHVIDVMQALPGYGLAFDVALPDEAIRDLERRGEDLLARAEQEAALRALPCKTKSRWGSISGLLLTEASAESVDLIAMHRRDLSRLERLFLGSITRAALLGFGRSVLITKGDLPATGPIHAVFGLDHSQYCMKSLEVLERFHLQGMKKITFVSAYEMHYLSDPEILVPADAKEDRQRWVAELEEKSRAVCDKFTRLGVECDMTIEEGPAVKVLGNAMSATGADLLILGAQGHGFLEQLVIGSVSLHMAAATPYSVLVLRV